MNPSVDVFKAIGRLKSNQDFLVFNKWLEEESFKATEAALKSIITNQSFKEQGSALTLRGLLAAIAAASPALAR